MQVSAPPGDSGVYEDISVGRVSQRGPGVTAVYVTTAGPADRSSALAGDFLYTAGEKLRISVPK